MEKGSRAFRNLSANPWCVETLDEYLERLASSDAVPGGGSAAALTGALAAALIAMVGRIRATPIEGLLTRADRLRKELSEARVRDEEAYSAVVAAQRMPQRDEREAAGRRHALDAALIRAAAAPLHAAALSVQVLRLTKQLVRTAPGALASDVGCAAELANASILACGYNVRVNHRYMREDSTVREQAVRLVRYEGEASRILARVREALAKAR